MKELSIEEKAKRYDEAIERAKSKIKNDKDHVLYENDVIEIFSELKELEDEKIRKNIIKAFKIFAGKQAWVSHCLDDIDWGACIAWLEKQREQKPVEKTTWYDNMDDLIADAMIDDIKNADMPEHCKHNRLTWINKHRSKPAWSEEDEKIYNLLYEEYKNIAYYSHSIEKAEDIPGEVLGWLKSLKDRVVPQPKPEWSEEDKEILNLIIARLHSHPNVDLEEYSKEYDWLYYNLKSLRPQNTWKPSEEQIRYLQAVVNNINNSGSESCHIILKELLKQLKTLI